MTLTRSCPGAAAAMLVLTAAPSARALAPAGRYTVTAQTVTDTKTGLVWQRGFSPVMKNWKDALAYCENLNLAPKVDWRLPSFRELISLVDHRVSSPTAAMIDLQAFPDTPADWFWSSTTSDLGVMVSVQFLSGNHESRTLIATQWVRCVRGPDPG